MLTQPRSRAFKAIVCFEGRPDGGLRAWSDDVPGFVLSHADVDRLLGDVKPALEMLLTARLGFRVEVQPLDDLRAALEDHGIVQPHAPPYPQKREYVALPA